MTDIDESAAEATPAEEVETGEAAEAEESDTPAEEVEA
jgi:hypothetical protein